MATCKYGATPSGWPDIGACITMRGKNLSEFSEIKQLQDKSVSGVVMGMHANKCIVQWKSTTSDQRIDLHMTKRKLNNLFNSKSGIEAGNASKKPRPDENSARSSSAAAIESSLVPRRINAL